MTNMDESGENEEEGVSRDPGLTSDNVEVATYFAGQLQPKLITPKANSFKDC